MSESTSAPGIAPAFTLWFRATTRGKWQPVAVADSYCGALEQIGVGGRRGGDWLVTEAGRSPDGSLGKR